MSGRPTLFGKTLDELTAVAQRVEMPSYGAKQISSWLYKSSITSIEEMSNISKKIRDSLSEIYDFGLTAPVNCVESTDGTKKYLFKVLGDNHIETVYIPETERATLCVSSQAGCKMGCLFCMTGRQGFQGNLTSSDILNQFRSVPEHQKLTNIVYMGMGEPLDNVDEVLKSLEVLTSSWGYGWSPSRITVSTVGIKSHIVQFLEKSSCHLAVSLHSPFDKERAALMPIQKSSSLDEILEIISRYDFSHQRRISFEYILFKGINDSPSHVKEIAKILNKIRCRINIIRFHTIPGSEFFSPNMNDTMRFRDALTAKGITTTIRVSRGEDIAAACGMLSTMQKREAAK